jgi:hypothetical protein
MDVVSEPNPSAARTCTAGAATLNPALPMNLVYLRPSSHGDEGLISAADEKPGLAAPPRHDLQLPLPFTTSPPSIAIIIVFDRSGTIFETVMPFPLPHVFGGKSPKILGRQAFPLFVCSSQIHM